MGYNFAFPEWMQRAKTEEDASGLALGRNILQGLQVRQQQQAYADNAPLREAQLGQQLAQTRIQQLDAEAQALNQGLIANARSGYVDVLKLQADGYSNPKGWLDPSIAQRAYELGAQNPGLIETGALTPIFKNIDWARQATDKSNEAQLTREATERSLQEKIQNSPAEQNISYKTKVAMHAGGFTSAYQERIDAGDTPLQAQAYAADAFPLAPQAAQKLMPSAGSNQQTLEDLGKLLDSNPTDPVKAMDAYGATISGQGSRKIAPAIEATKSRVQALQDIGIQPPIKDIKDAFGQQLTGGSSVNAPPKTIANLDTENTSMGLLDQVGSSIKEFNKKYGTNFEDFAQFIGPWDNLRLNIKKGLLDPSQLSAATNEAANILQKTQQIVQGYRNAQFGTALTENETRTFEKIFSSPAKADFVRSLLNFRDTLHDTMKIQVQPYLMAPNVRLEYLRRFWQPSTEPNASGVAPAASSSPSVGIKIIREIK